MLVLAYSTAVVLTAAVGSLLLLASALRRRQGLVCGLVMALLTPVLCLVCARAYYLLVSHLGGMWLGSSDFLSPEPYDYAFGGGVLGFVLSLCLTALLCRKPLRTLGDVFAPAGLGGMALLRLAEALTDFGWGDAVDAAWMQRYPFAIQNMFGEWCSAVFNLEALCALVILVVLLLCKLPGRRLSTALLWWAVCQIFCESLRVESVQWGFVRVQQVQSALIALTLLVIATLRMPRGLRHQALAYWGGFLLAVGAVAFLEFAIDKMPWPTFVNYVLMAAAVGLMGFCPQRLSALAHQGEAA